MTCRLGIVGLNDEVSSQVYLERCYIQDWNHRTSWNRVRVEAAGQHTERPKELGAQRLSFMLLTPSKALRLAHVLLYP